MSERSEDIENLIKPRGESKEYSDDMRDLMHTQEILDQLRREVLGGPSIGWDKLYQARKYIDKLIQEHLESEKDK